MIAGGRRENEMNADCRNRAFSGDTQDQFSSWSFSWAEKMVTPVSTAIIKAPNKTVKARKEEQVQFVPAKRNWCVIFAFFFREHAEAASALTSSKYHTSLACLKILSCIFLAMMEILPELSD